MGMKLGKVHIGMWYKFFLRNKRLKTDYSEGKKGDRVLRGEWALVALMVFFSKCCFEEFELNSD